MTPLIAKKASLVTPVPKILPQLVPSSACFRCEICCRFPDPDSVLRPYFSGEEIDRAVEHGLPAAAFPDRHGSQVALVPDANGDGFHCPALRAKVVPAASTTTDPLIASSIPWRLCGTPLIMR